MSNYSAAEKKVIQSRINLLQNNPFFGYIGMYLKPICDKEGNVTTDATPFGVTDTGDLHYSPAWVEKLSVEQIKGVIAHEILHLALDHIPRRRSRDAFAWNIAADMVVNDMVFKSELKLIDGCVRCPRKFKDLTAEQIYEQLPKTYIDFAHLSRGSGAGKASEKLQGKSFDSMTKAKKKNDGAGAGDKAKDKSKGEGFIEGGKQEVRDSKFWKEKVADAAQYAKSIGKLPGGLEQMLEWVLGPQKLSWKNVLMRMVSGLVVSDYSYSYPSKKSYAIGVYTPRTKKETLKIWIALDTSGSIDDDEYKEFLTEVFGILSVSESVEAKVWLCDGEVQKEVTGSDKYEIMDKLKKRRGYGGTDFRPVFREATKANAKLLIFFTDLLGSFPSQESVKTIWVRTGSNEKPPFGQLVDLRSGEWY